MWLINYTTFGASGSFFIHCLFFQNTKNYDEPKFLNAEDNFVFGQLCDNYHGEALTTTREAWKSEISIMKEVLSGLSDKNGDIIFEYDIPRLGR